MRITLLWIPLIGLLFTFWILNSAFDIPIASQEHFVKVFGRKKVFMVRFLNFFENRKRLRAFIKKVFIFSPSSMIFGYILGNQPGSFFSTEHLWWSGSDTRGWSIWRNAGNDTLKSVGWVQCIKMWKLVPRSPYDTSVTLKEEILAGRKFGGFGGFCKNPPN